MRGRDGVAGFGKTFSTPLFYEKNTKENVAQSFHVAFCKYKIKIEGGNFEILRAGYLLKYIL